MIQSEINSFTSIWIWDPITLFLTIKLSASSPSLPVHLDRDLIHRQSCRKKHWPRVMPQHGIWAVIILFYRCEVSFWNQTPNQLSILDRLPVLHSSKVHTTSNSLSRNKIIDYAFSNGKALQSNSSLLIFTHTLYKRKPHFSSSEGMNSPCRRFDLLFSPCWFNLSLLTTLTIRVLVRHGFDHQRVRRYAPFH